MRHWKGRRMKAKAKLKYTVKMTSEEWLDLRSAITEAKAALHSDPSISIQTRNKAGQTLRKFLDTAV